MAQVAVKVHCGFCAKDQNVNWYCKECAQNVCDDCKKVHIKTLNYHDIISVFDGYFVDRSFETKCKKHHEYFQFHCKKCTSNICITCSKKGHKKHDVETIGAHAKKTAERFTQDLTQEHSYLDNLQQKKDKDIKEYEIQLFREIKRQIIAVQEETTRQIDVLRATERHMKDTLLNHEMEAKHFLQNELKNNENAKETFKKEMEKMRNKLYYVPNAGLMQFIAGVKLQLPSVAFRSEFDAPQFPIFIPAQFDMHGENVLGSIKYSEKGSTVNAHTDMIEPVIPKPVKEPNQTKTISPPTVRRKLEVVRQFTPDPRGRRVDSVCIADDGSYWVGIYTGYDTGENTGDILLVNPNGNVKQTIHLSHTADYSIMMSDGNLLVSGCTPDITKVNKNGQQRTFLSGPNVGRVFGMITSHDNCVFVCYRMPSDTKDEIIKFDNAGERLFRLDSTIFSSSKLYGIHKATDGSLCVQDGVYDGRLVFVDTEGKFIRSLQRMENLQDNFKEMVWDRHGYILAGTSQAEYLHVFSGEGTCLRTYHIQGSGKINGLFIGEDNMILVGTKSGKVVVAKYL